MYSDEFRTLNARGGSRYHATVNILACVQASISPAIYAPSPRYPEHRVDESAHFPVSPSRPVAPGPPDPNIIYNPDHLLFDLNQRSHYVPLRTAEDLCQPSWARLARDLCDEVGPFSVVGNIVLC